MNQAKHIGYVGTHPLYRTGTEFFCRTLYVFGCKTKAELVKSCRDTIKFINRVKS